MLQRPTTHKDLHRAVAGSGFSLALACLFSASSLGAPSQTVPTGANVVKNGAASAAEVKTPKLRAIPGSTLAPEKKSPATTESATSAKDSKMETPKDQPAQTQTVKRVDKPAATKPKPAKSKPAKQTNATTTQPRLNNGLVPPPPPIAPIGMDTLGMFAQPVDYLSMKELEARKKELTVRLNELSSIVGDGERQIRERKERAELFESLYQEGVVSRKELEVARREAGEIDRDLKFKQDELESVKVSMRAVNNRLAVLKKIEAKMNAVKEKTGKRKAGPADKISQKKH